MPVLSPTGQERARTIDHNLTHARRDSFVSHRGLRIDGASITKRQRLIAEQVGKEIVESTAPLELPDLDESEEAQAWEEERLAEERSVSETKTKP